MLGLLLIGGVGIISWLVQSRFKSRMNEYSQIGMSNGLTGRDIAERMLKQNGVYDVKVVPTSGMLTDHYDPSTKTVALSEIVYGSNSIAAGAVAAHECGHAIQHQTAYGALGLRSGLVPVANFCNKILMFANMGMMFMGGMMYSNGGGISSLFISIFLLANIGVTVFSLITLPVEFDASKRALAWIESNAIVNPEEQKIAKDALHWAAMTYVVAALGAIANLLYWLMILMGRRNNNE